MLDLLLKLFILFFVLTVGFLFGQHHEKSKHEEYEE